MLTEVIWNIQIFHKFLAKPNSLSKALKVLVFDLTKTTPILRTMNNYEPSESPGPVFSLKYLQLDFLKIEIISVYLV